MGPVIVVGLSWQLRPRTPTSRYQEANPGIWVEKTFDIRKMQDLSGRGVIWQHRSLPSFGYGIVVRCPLHFL